MWLLKPVSQSWRLMQLLSSADLLLLYILYKHMTSSTVILVCLPRFLHHRSFSIFVSLSPRLSLNRKSCTTNNKIKPNWTKNIRIYTVYIFSGCFDVSVCGPQTKRSLRTRRKWKPVWHWIFRLFAPACLPDLCIFVRLCASSEFQCQSLCFWGYSAKRAL